MTTNDNLDLVWGAKEIGKIIGRNERMTFHLLTTGEIPGAKRVGGRWVIERTKLISFFMDAA